MTCLLCGGGIYTSADGTMNCTRCGSTLSPAELDEVLTVDDDDYENLDDYAEYLDATFDPCEYEPCDDEPEYDYPSYEGEQYDAFDI